MIKLVDNISLVPSEKIKPNKWNPNRQSEFIYEKEIASIKKHGFVDPITVRETDDGFEIIDGEHRWKAALALDMSEVLVNNLGKISDIEAKELTIILNEVKGKADKVLMGNLVSDLVESSSLEMVVESLPFTSSEIEFFTENSNIDWSAISDSQQKTDKTASDEDWEDLLIRLPIKVKESFLSQLSRLKEAIQPGAGDAVSDVQAIEYLTQIVTLIPDEHLVFGG